MPDYNLFDALIPLLGAGKAVDYSGKFIDLFNQQNNRFWDMFNTMTGGPEKKDTSFRRIEGTSKPVPTIAQQILPDRTKGTPVNVARQAVQNVSRVRKETHKPSPVQVAQVAVKSIAVKRMPANVKVPSGIKKLLGGF